MRNKGFTLVFALFIISALLLVAAAAGRLAFNSASAEKRYKESLQAYYLAEAALEYGKTRLRSNPSWCTPGTTVRARTGTFTVKREPEGKEVIGVGQAGGARAIIKLYVIGRGPYLQREE